MARKSDEDLILEIHARFEEAKGHSNTWRDDARKDFGYYNGAEQQWDPDDFKKLEEEGRPAVSFNRVGVIVDAIVGAEINNRKEVRYIPREMGDIRPSEALSGAAEWARDLCDAEDEESDAFADCVICGMGWTETRMSYDHDPEGRIIIERVDPLQMYWDPSARSKNLGDARWILRLKEVNVEEAKERWPELENYASGQSPWDGAESHDETGLHPYPDRAYSGRDATAPPISGRVYIAQYQWVEAETYWRVQNPADGSIEEIPAEAWSRLKKNIPEIRGARFDKRTCMQAFTAGGVLLSKGPLAPDPTGRACEAFTLRCMTAKRDRNRGLWFGMMRNLRDPQRWANKFFSQILHIINTNAKGGIIAEKTAFDDPRRIEETWARPDSIAWANEGAVSGGKITPKPTSAYPTGLDRLMNFAVLSIPDISGVNLEMLGLASREQPGILEQQRKQAALTILANLFDALRRYRKEQGRVLLHFILAYIPDGRLVRILGPDGTGKYVQFVRERGLSEYDIIVDDSPTSPNQKEKVFSALVELFPAMAKYGVPVPPEILDYAPIPSALAQSWKQYIAERSGNPQEMQMQLQEAAQAVQKLEQENQRLKTDQAVKAQEIQQKHEIAVAEAMMDRDKNTKELELDREKAMQELALEREKAMHEINLERQKAEANIQIEWAKLQADAKIQAIRASAESQVKQGKSKRNVKFKRNDDGMIVEAEIEHAIDTPSGAMSLGTEIAGAPQ